MEFFPLGKIYFIKEMVESPFFLVKNGNIYYNFL